MLEERNRKEMFIKKVIEDVLEHNQTIDLNELEKIFNFKFNQLKKENRKLGSNVWIERICVGSNDNKCFVNVYLNDDTLIEREFNCSVKNKKEVCEVIKTEPVVEPVVDAIDEPVEAEEVVEALTEVDEVVEEVESEPVQEVVEVVDESPAEPVVKKRAGRPKKVATE